jgi:hypothetical protein
MLTLALKPFITSVCTEQQQQNFADVVVAVAAGGGGKRLGPTPSRTMLGQDGAKSETSWLAGDAVWL